MIIILQPSQADPERCFFRIKLDPHPDAKTFAASQLYDSRDQAMVDISLLMEPTDPPFTFQDLTDG